LTKEQSFFIRAHAQATSYYNVFGNSLIFPIFQGYGLFISQQYGHLSFQWTCMLNQFIYLFFMTARASSSSKVNGHPSTPGGHTWYYAQSFPSYL
jgi:hypothetical protein